jgi:hypothetical protein
VSERNIAEVIGWRLIPSSDSSIWPPWWLGPNGVRSDVMPEPTVDDLLVWLRPRVITDGALTRMKIEPTHDGWNVMVWPVIPVAADHSAPTLLDALEAAVSAIAAVCEGCDGP